MIYLDIDFIRKTVFPVIREYYNKKMSDPVPEYEKEPHGMSHLEGLLERLRMDYHADFFSKATRLFININKGHFFQNGNKRLALATLVAFIVENGYRFSEISETRFEVKLCILFPNCALIEHYDFFRPSEFALYNLSIIVADSHRHVASHDDLKERVKQFLIFSVEH